MAEMTDIAARIDDRVRRRGGFAAGRDVLARHRAPLGKAGLAEADRRLAALLPEWG